MIGVVMVLVVIGVCLYLLQQIPMDPVILTIIRVVVLLAVVVWIIQAFGLLAGPLPRLR